jgi:hypothetical protein
LHPVFYFSERSDIPFNSFIVIEPTRERLNDLLIHRAKSFGIQPVVIPFAPFLALQETRVTKRNQMMREFGLRHIEYRHQLANTRFTIHKQ